MRFGEQAKLLKEEIRRLERNREREEGVSNMEYLKNVVLKVGECQCLGLVSFSCLVTTHTHTPGP